eukprot:scaffold701_cov158-Amphora_coffeaeformis.AAC.11
MSTREISWKFRTVRNFDFSVPISGPRVTLSGQRSHYHRAQTTDVAVFSMGFGTQTASCHAVLSWSLWCTVVRYRIRRHRIIKRRIHCNVLADDTGGSDFLVGVAVWTPPSFPSKKLTVAQPRRTRFVARHVLVGVASATL